MATAGGGQHWRIDTSGPIADAEELRALLGRAELVPGAADDRAAGTLRDAVRGVARQLDDYVIPRLRDLDAPALVVVGGSTGSGKSTIVNSLVGAEVTRPGVLRPTTRAPVLVHHPDAARWFTDDRVLGSFARVQGGDASGPQQLRLVASDAVGEALALLDAPDIDSVEELNRAAAGHLLDAADLWVFVTTAARYADAVPWDVLATARARGVGVALVLNRVPPGAGGQVAAHLREMLTAAGLGEAPLLVLDEQPLVQGRLPAAQVAPLRDWLAGIAADHDVRAELVRQGLRGTLADVADRTDAVVEALERRADAADRLRDQAASTFARTRAQLARDVRDGTVMRGEVLARWQDLVGTGELLRQLQSRIGRWRDRVVSAVTGRTPAVEGFQGAVESGVELLVRERVAAAVDEVGALWRTTPDGEAVLAGGLAEDGLPPADDLSRPSVDLPARTERLVRDWQAALLDLLRAEGSGRRMTAKVLSYGVNGVALVLMVGVFAQTGGLTGGEVAIAGGSTAVGSTLLEALLGDQAVRRLTERARADLDARLAALLNAEAARFTRAVDARAPDPTLAVSLRDAARALRRGLS
ncbi:ABC transporter [Euzebya sp.]|uniref:ABC transporter n=1 Tax=Euzebya sp. TaxID=1971409 RepID=UPI003513391C